MIGVRVVFYGWCGLCALALLPARASAGSVPGVRDTIVIYTGQDYEMLDEDDRRQIADFVKAVEGAARMADMQDPRSRSRIVHSIPQELPEDAAKSLIEDTTLLYMVRGEQSSRIDSEAEVGADTRLRYHFHSGGGLKVGESAQLVVLTYAAMLHAEQKRHPGKESDTIFFRRVASLGWQNAVDFFGLENGKIEQALRSRAGPGLIQAMCYFAPRKAQIVEHLRDESRRLYELCVEHDFGGAGGIGPGEHTGGEPRKTEPERSGRAAGDEATGQGPAQPGGHGRQPRVRLRDGAASGSGQLASGR